MAEMSIWTIARWEGTWRAMLAECKIQDGIVLLSLNRRQGMAVYRAWQD